MQRKLTLTVDEEVYRGLHDVIGCGRISRFIEDLVRPYVIHRDVDTAYRAMAEEEERETDALEWSEALITDVPEEAAPPMPGGGMPDMGGY